jgi:hypothetical protein
MTTEMERIHHSPTFKQHRSLKIALMMLFLLLLPCFLFAEGEGSADATTATPTNTTSQAGEKNADFSFEAPRGFVGFRLGRFFPRADSDLFDMVTGELTLEKKDFRAWDIGVDAGFRPDERIDIIFSFDYSRRTKASESRDYVDDQGQPITQTTEFTHTPITAGIKFLLVPRGQQVGRYAWLPSRIVPFIGGGGGVLWYRFRQEGDFVDSQSLEIFSARLESDGWAPTVYAGGGADINVFKSVYLVLDLRYAWAKADLNRDFVGFKPIDLSGPRVTAGLHWHF